MSEQPTPTINGIPLSQFCDRCRPRLLHSATIEAVDLCAACSTKLVDAVVEGTGGKASRHMAVAMLTRILGQRMFAASLGRAGGSAPHGRPRPKSWQVSSLRGLPPDTGRPGYDWQIHLTMADPLDRDLVIGYLEGLPALADLLRQWVSVQATKDLDASAKEAVRHHLAARSRQLLADIDAGFPLFPGG